jgi:hypothetical protein
MEYTILIFIGILIGTVSGLLGIGGGPSGLLGMEPWDGLWGMNGPSSRLLGAEPLES